MATNPHLARLDALEAKVAALEKSDTSNDLRIEIEQLQELLAQGNCHRQWRDGFQSTEVADAIPLWTERVNLDSTVKDGYRVKECTVTVQNAGGDEQTREERRRRIAEAIEDGQAVADQLNSQREQVKRFA